MKLSLLEWIERSVLAVWEKIADFLAKDREARKAAPEHAADPLIIIPIPKNRTYLAFFGILMLFFILAGRTFYLQVFNNDFLQNEGEKRFARTITIQGPRGEILDRNGIVLASSQPCRSVWADPALVPRSTKEEKQQLRELAKLLGIKYSELLKKLDHSSSPNFVYLARNRDLGLAEAGSPASVCRPKCAAAIPTVPPWLTSWDTRVRTITDRKASNLPATMCWQGARARGA